MTDYTHAAGSSATMMIRDNGLAVEFWINSNNSTTWTDHLPWGGTVNGTGVGGSYYYHPGSGWNRLGVWNVWTSQNVTFSLGNTGTSGFGSGTSFTQFINRTSPPNPPTNIVATAITSTTIDLSWTLGANNGGAIDTTQSAYGVDPNAGQYFINTSGTTLHITGLAPGTKYYFWAISHNSAGYGAWSARTQFTTQNVPDAPSAPVITDVTQKTATATFTDNGNGGAEIDGHRMGWTTNGSNPSSSISATSPQAITGLTPGTTYYFFAATHNSVGWSPWSAPTVAKTVAGARIKVGTDWHDAVPYVRTGGVWKVARPWTRSAGVWKETQ